MRPFAVCADGGAPNGGLTKGPSHKPLEDFLGLNGNSFLNLGWNSGTLVEVGFSLFLLCLLVRSGRRCPPWLLMKGLHQSQLL